MGLFGNIENSKFSEGGNYITDGNYLLQIEKVFYLLSRTKKDLFGVEFIVLERNPESKHKVGELVSWMLNLANEPSLGNIKQFIQCVAGDLNATVTEDDVYKIMNEDPNKYAGVIQPFKGEKVRGTFVTVAKKRSAGMFTKAKFFIHDDTKGASENFTAEAAKAA